MALFVGNFENNRLDGGADADVAFGFNGRDTINGRGGDDALFGNTDLDLLRGGGGNDYLYGGTDPDTLLGGAGDDHLQGISGNDLMNGGAGNDVLSADVGDDFLRGGAGDDVLFGADNVDTLSGGVGKDTLFGGGINADVFLFKPRDGKNDVIVDFSVDEVDQIDLTAFDGVLEFRGTRNFDGAGQVRFEQRGDDVLVEVNTDADNTAEVAFTVLNVVSLKEGDFDL